MYKAGNILEAEANLGAAQYPPHLVLKNVFQFLRDTGCSVHTAHEEENFPACLLARIVAAVVACGSVRCTFYTS